MSPACVVIEANPHSILHISPLAHIESTLARWQASSDLSQTYLSLSYAERAFLGSSVTPPVPPFHPRASPASPWCRMTSHFEIDPWRPKHWLSRGDTTRVLPLILRHLNFAAPSYRVALAPHLDALPTYSSYSIKYEPHAGCW